MGPAGEAFPLIQKAVDNASAGDTIEMHSGIYAEHICLNEDITLMGVDTGVPPIKDIRFVHYDEQHPKAGRNQKYRLTLLNSLTRQVIADELFDSKDAATIEDFPM